MRSHKDRTHHGRRAEIINPAAFAGWIRSDHHRRRLDQVKMTTIPQIGPDDPPAADQTAVGSGAHGDAAISFGNRTRS